MTAPKLFVSYSWTNPEHEARVLQLATDLRESGVDVILDKWDLREGHDAHAFMERMVTDDEIRKVILVCDRGYVEKADQRSGGVGTESQIISAEIYASANQDKFVAVVVELQDDGHPFLPAYYRSRIFIDFTDVSRGAESFEQLLRWVFDKPIYQKPALGKPPSFLSDGASGTKLATSARFRLAADAIRASRQNAIPLVAEYLETFATEMEKIRLPSVDNGEDDAIVASIDDFIASRNEAVELFLLTARYHSGPDIAKLLHDFFESLIPYLTRPRDITSWKEWDFDNFRFIIQELFLYAVATLIYYERFAEAGDLIGTDYYVANHEGARQSSMLPFSILWAGTSSLTARNERLELRRLSLRADMLIGRCKGLAIQPRHLMQADFILYLRESLEEREDYRHWWPDTLLYSQDHYGPFEIFARARSRRYLDKILVLLGISDKDSIEDFVKKVAQRKAFVPQWQFTTVNVAQLVGVSELASRP